MTFPATASSRWATTGGLPFPLGPTRIEEEDACNFALYSKHAESVTLLLYTESDLGNPVLAYRFDYLKNKTGRVWHCRIPFAAMQDASYYAYSVEGPSPNGRFDAWWEELTFHIQEGAAKAWRRVIDTSLERPFDFLEPSNEIPMQSLQYRVPGRAVVVLVRDQDQGDLNEN